MSAPQRVRSAFLMPPTSCPLQVCTCIAVTPVIAAHRRESQSFTALDGIAQRMTLTLFAVNKNLRDARMDEILTLLSFGHHANDRPLARHGYCFVQKAERNSNGRQASGSLCENR